MNNSMVFDGESYGLHRSTFAVGYVVINKKGQELESGIARLNDEAILYGLNRIPIDTADWLKTNVLPTIEDVNNTFTNPYDLRNWFWNKWLEWREKDTELVSDVAWPVETNFLSDCVRDNMSEREWQGPYPLLDLASYLKANNLNPIGTFPRRKNELPCHNPLNDARQSARVYNQVKNNLEYARRFMELIVDVDIINMHKIEQLKDEYEKEMAIPV